MAKTLREQLDKLKNILRSSQYAAESPILQHLADFLIDFPGELADAERLEIEGLACQCFTITPEQWRAKIAPTAQDIKPVQPFDELVPEGWLRDYITATQESEPPTVFHFFCAATILGAMTERHIWLNKGHYKVFPALNVILIAPSGKARKSAAINLAEKVIRLAGYEKFILGTTTPEAFTMALAQQDPASCLILAGEMKRFYRNTKYMESFIPLITELMECKDESGDLTVGRGKLKLLNIMVSGMYGTTMRWMRHMPPDMFGGGFLRRNIVVVQERTDRVFAIPRGVDSNLIPLAERLKVITYNVHEYKFTKDAEEFYVDWYAKFRRREDMPTDDLFDGYLESKPDHALRLAMLIEISQQRLELDITSIKQALAILDWTDQFLPQTFSSLTGNELTEMHNRVLNYIRAGGGRLAHSDLVRKMSKYMNSAKLAETLHTLIEAELVEAKMKTLDEPRSYYLTRKGLEHHL